MKIIVLDGYALNPGDLNWQGFEELGDLTVYQRTQIEKILERSQGAEIVLSNKTPLNENTLSQLPILKYIGVLATGYNVIDTAFAKQKGIVVTNVPAYGTDSVAQMTFALLLELSSHAQRYANSVAEGKWVRSKDWCYLDFPLIELAGKTMGIVGYGNIGRKVGDIATAFGMKVIATSRKMQTKFSGQREWATIEELLEKSDFISLNCPLTDETRGIINKNNLKKMKPTAFLINTARGPLVNEQDLADALNQNVIAGAALDVLSQEPPKTDNPLFRAKNCIITPHISWATKEARQRLMNIAIENLRAFLSGSPINVVNS